MRSIRITVPTTVTTLVDCLWCRRCFPPFPSFHGPTTFLCLSLFRVNRTQVSSCTRPRHCPTLWSLFNAYMAIALTDAERDLSTTLAPVPFTKDLGFPCYHPEMIPYAHGVYTRLHEHCCHVFYCLTCNVCQLFFSCVLVLSRLTQTPAFLTLPHSRKTPGQTLSAMLCQNPTSSLSTIVFLSVASTGFVLHARTAGTLRVRMRPTRCVTGRPASVRSVIQTSDRLNDEVKRHAYFMVIVEHIDRSVAVYPDYPSRDHVSAPA